MKVARVYAKALFQAAGGQDQVASELREVSQSLSTSKDAQNTLLGPSISGKEKALVMGDIAKKMGVSPVVHKFVVLLAQKGRLGALSEIELEYSKVRWESQGGVMGTIEAADGLSAEDLSDIKEAFSKKLGKKVDFTVSTNPDLIAGMRVQVQGITYDGTLRSQLQKLKEQLLA